MMASRGRTELFFWISDCAMRLSTIIISSLLCSYGTIAIADDPVFSGPQIGESLAPFEIVLVYDESAGRKVDPIANADGKPTLLVFVHKLTRPGIAITRAVTSYARDQADQGAVGAIVWLGLNRNVELTILVAKDNEVTANFALVQPSVTEAAKIAGELARLIDQPAPTQKQMESLAYPGGAMMRNRARASSNSAQKQMMRGIIAAAGDDEKLARAVKAMEDWVDDNERRQQSLARLSAELLKRGRGQAAQKVLQAWVEEYGQDEAEKRGEETK